MEPSHAPEMVPSLDHMPPHSPGERKQRGGGSRASQRSARSARSAGGSRDAARNLEVLEARSSRKRAEADVQLLANRLNHLRLEEEKARRKISETKTRAKQIVTQKKRVRATRSLKATRELDRDNEVRGEHDRLIVERDRNRRQVRESKRVVERARKAQASEGRTIRRKVNEEAVRIRAAAQEANKKKAAAIRKRHEEQRRRREIEQKRKEQQAEELHQQRVQAEIERAQAADAMVAQLEAEEAALIERLKRTQESQRKAYEELQRSLEV